MVCCVLAIVSGVWNPPTGVMLVCGESSYTSKEVTRAEEIDFWEKEIALLRENHLRKALRELDKAAESLERVKSKAGYFPDAETRKTIKVLDEEYHLRLEAVSRVRKEEEGMLAHLKPLYGVLSVHFAQEQKDQIANSITYVKDATFQNAIWESMFDLGSADSFSDVIIGFLVKWITGFILLYPFAILYYALWSLPWSIYAYSSGFLSFFSGAGVYILSVLVMSSPLIVLFGGIAIVRKIEAKRMGEKYRNLHRD